MPDLLATRAGRLTAFFLLYATEGIPLGFTAVAIATQMRRQGLDPAAIGFFVGSLYLPWAFKWVMGPFVDTFTSDRFGRRRTWILGAQVAMAAMLFVAMPVDYVTQLGLFTAIIFVHNACAATMDVAIDALAVNVLPEHERGVANGFMFAGASIGQAIGGAGVLYLAALMPFPSTYFFVAGTILLVTVFVVLPLREPPGPPREATGKSALAAAAADIGRFVREAWQAFTGSRGALVGLVAAVLPFGAYALSLALSSNIAVELGMSDTEIGNLTLVGTIVFAIACVGAGWLSDRFGRRSTLAVCVFLTVVPTLWLAWKMQQFGWIMPVDVKASNRPTPDSSLLATFWVTNIAFNVFQGAYYGIRSALYMDVTTPKVAATQFTAYMALSNLVISYTSWWQGLAMVRWGYPVTLVLDSAAGLVVLLLVPLMTARRAARAATATP
ncbi:MAG: MFS transporter [Burkholderiales bacterium]|nr:MFS transporter [Burkholderiales bacterium]